MTAANHTNKTPLGLAVTWQARVLGVLAARLLNRNECSCVGAWLKPSGALVIVAIGNRADRIADELERAGLLTAQTDHAKALRP